MSFQVYGENSSICLCWRMEDIFSSANICGILFVAEVEMTDISRLYGSADTFPSGVPSCSGYCIILYLLETARPNGMIVMLPFAACAKRLRRHMSIYSLNARLQSIALKGVQGRLVFVYKAQPMCATL